MHRTIYICASAYIHICMYMYTFLHVCVQIGTHVYTYTYLHAYSCVIKAVMSRSCKDYVNSEGWLGQTPRSTCDIAPWCFLQLFVALFAGVWLPFLLVSSFRAVCRTPASSCARYRPRLFLGQHDLRASGNSLGFHLPFVERGFATVAEKRLRGLLASPPTSPTLKTMCLG